MTARTIGAVTPDGHVTCVLCTWATTDRLDPLGALSQHRKAKHPGNRGKTITAAAPRRDPAGATLGASIAGLFAALAITAWTAGGWWIIAAIPCALLALLGLYGLVSDLQRVPQNHRGHRIR